MAHVRPSYRPHKFHVTTVNVLMLSHDNQIAAKRPASENDSYARHATYAQALAQQIPGSKLIILAPASKDSRASKIEAEGLVVHSLAAPRLLYATACILRAHAIDQEDPLDLITTQTPFDDGIAGHFLSRSLGTAFHVQMHSSFVDHPHWMRERPGLNYGLSLLAKSVLLRADGIRVVSRGEKERVTRLMPALEEKTMHLPPMLNDVFLRPPSDAEAREAQRAAATHGISSAFVLLVGRIVKQKDIATALQAFQIIREAGVDLDLVIAGEGPERDMLEGRANNLGISPYVHWLGSIPSEELRGWYQAAQCTIVSSIHEGFGRVIAESYLMATPVVSTNVVSAPELIRDGETGFIVPIGDEQQLAARLRTLLKDKVFARAMGRRGKDHVESYFPPRDEYLVELVEMWVKSTERRKMVAGNRD